MRQEALIEIGQRIASVDAEYGIMCIKDGRIIYAHNEDSLIQCASCIKCFIAIAIYQKIANGEINREDKVELLENNIVEGAGVLRFLPIGAKLRICDYLSLMLIISDNTAANVLLQLVGISYVNRILDEKGFQKTRIHNAFYRSNYHDIAVTTAREYCILFNRLSRGEIINEKFDKEILDILKKQKFKQILMQAIVEKEPNAKLTICSKSGKIDGSAMGCANSIICDGGMVYLENACYSVSILAQLPGETGTEGLRACASNSSEISRILYHEIADA